MENPKIFFSYARDDGDFVLELARKLRAEGVYLWLDQLDIKPGELWDQAVEKALDTCECLILVLSPASVESLNVMDEVSFALENGKQVVPVVKEACKIPFRLRRVQHIDLSQDYETGIATLLETLRQAGAGSPTADAAKAPEATAAAAPAPVEKKASKLPLVLGGLAMAAAAAVVAGTLFLGPGRQAAETAEIAGTPEVAEAPEIAAAPEAPDVAAIDVAAPPPAPMAPEVIEAPVEVAPTLVPRLVGQSESDARRALRTAGLYLGDVTEKPSSHVRAGQVIRTDPPAGASSEPGQEVDLVVSAGAWIWLDHRPRTGSEYRMPRAGTVRAKPHNQGTPLGEVVNAGERIAIVEMQGGWAQFVRSR